MSKARKGGLGRGLNSLISSTGSEPISRPADVFFPEAVSGESESAGAKRPRGGSARDLLLPGGGKTSRRTQKSSAKKSTSKPAEKKPAESTGRKSTQRETIESVAENVSRETSDLWGIVDAVEKDGAKSDTQNVSRETTPSFVDAESGIVSRETIASDSAAGKTDSVPLPGEATVEAASDPLIRDAHAAGLTATFAQIVVDSIHPNAKQPRNVFDEEDLHELADSIRQVGVLQPVVVRPDGDSFELIMGERRWRASQVAGLKTIPAIIRWTDDDAMLRDALLENLHRAQLNPLEEAAAYQQLLQEFGCSHQELAQRIARSRPVITNTLRLLQLPASVQTRVAAKVLSAGHARALLSLDNPDDMEYLADRIVSEGLSVRSTEEIVALGDVRGGVRAARRGTQKLGRIDRLETTLERQAAERLTDALDTKVKVTLGAKRGRIVIEFADEQDLQRIIDRIQPELS